MKTYDKPDYAVSAWWVCEFRGLIYRAWNDGRVQTLNCNERPPAIADGRWLPITLPTFPPKPEPPKPLEFVAGKKYRTRDGDWREYIGETKLREQNFRVFSGENGALYSTAMNGRRFDDCEHGFDIIAEWSEPNPRVKVPRLFTAKHRGKEVRGCYFPRDVAHRHDHVYPDEYGTLWCEPSQLTDIVYLTPEYEDEL